MEYKVEDTELISIANAIRSACNLSDELEFPTDFIAKIATLDSAYIGKDTEPYLYRKSPTSIGTNYNSAEIDKLIGGTVAWNQLVQNGNFQSDTNWNSPNASRSISNNILTLTANSSNAQLSQGRTLTLAKDHKVYIKCGIKSSVARNDVRLRLSQDSPIANMQYVSYNLSANTHTVMQGILNIPDNLANTRFSILSPNSVNGDTYEIDNFICVDLTQAFGSTIADYIYSLEQTTAGSGIAWLKSHGFLTKDYYAYNEGSLLSVKTSEHRTVGKNKCDINGFRPSAPSVNVSVSGQTITVSGGSSVGYPSANYGSTSELLFPAGTYYIKANVKSVMQTGIGAVFGLRNASNAFKASIGLNITGEKTLTATITEPCYFSILIKGNGQTGIENTVVIENIMVSTDDSAFEPYHINSYPLDSDLELRGIPKLSNGSLYYDGDVYESSGAVTRKYKLITFDGSSDETWSANATYQGLYYIATPTDCQVAQTPLCNRFLGLANQAAVDISAKVGCMAMTNGLSSLNFMTNHSSLADFKTWLASNPVQVLLQLATPTTEQADSYANPQIVNPLGTEEYVDTRDVPVPVGHETKYHYRREVV